MWMAPLGRRPCRSQNERSRIGFGFGRKRVCSGAGDERLLLAETAWRYVRILVMFPGCELRVMMVVTPADVASLAATTLVNIPPVPRLEPGVVTGDGLVV